MSSTEEIQDTVEAPTTIKSKPKRTAAQLVVLSQAREKALIVRRENAELRRKEKELAKLEKEEELRERREKLDRLLADKKKPKGVTYKAVTDEPEAPSAPAKILEEETPEDEGTEIIYKKKPKKARKQKIVYVSGSESDEPDEPQIVYRRKPHRPPGQQQQTRFSQPERQAQPQEENHIYRRGGYNRY